MSRCPSPSTGRPQNSSLCSASSRITVIFFSLSAVGAFPAHRGIISRSPQGIVPTRQRVNLHNDPTRLFASNEENDKAGLKNDDGDDDGDLCRPYGNRSLAWTKRYRKLIPYETARAQAVAMGMSTQEEYQRWRKGPYQIQRPDEMYAAEWISWDEFLGSMRSYEDTQKVVRLLQLKSMEEYHDFVRLDPKRAEGLRIPAKPDIVYRDCGWESPQAFFGTSDSITNNE